MQSCQAGSLRINDQYQYVNKTTRMKNNKNRIGLEDHNRQLTMAINQRPCRGQELKGTRNNMKKFRLALLISIVVGLICLCWCYCDGDGSVAAPDNRINQRRRRSIHTKPEEEESKPLLADPGKESLADQAFAKAFGKYY